MQFIKHIHIQPRRPNTLPYREWGIGRDPTSVADRPYGPKLPRFYQEYSGDQKLIHSHDPDYAKLRRGDLSGPYKRYSKYKKYPFT